METLVRLDLKLKSGEYSSYSLRGSFWFKKNIKLTNILEYVYQYLKKCKISPKNYGNELEVWVNDKLVSCDDPDTVDIPTNSTIIIRRTSDTKSSLQENTSMHRRNFSVEQLRVELSKATTAANEAAEAVSNHNSTVVDNLRSELEKAFDPEVAKFKTSNGKDREFVSRDVQGRIQEVTAAYPLVTNFVSADWTDAWTRRLDALVGDTIEMTDGEFDQLRAQVDQTVSQAESTVSSVS